MVQLGSRHQFFLTSKTITQEVKLWSYPSKNLQKLDLQFCGLIMGDHSKTAINTQFNTGTVVGVGANIFKSGFPPNLIEYFFLGADLRDENLD